MSESNVTERAGFRRMDESTAEDWAVIMGHDDALAALPDRILGQLRLLDSGESGFAVDRLTHSLQTAHLAELDGRDEAYLICALVHDIGDVLGPLNHADIAAAVLRPWVSDPYHWMVQQHGVFQGYYFWHHIGLDRNTREQFRGTEHFEYTEEFCAKYDQTAFDADYRSEPLEHFEPLIRARLVTSVPSS